MAEGNGSGRLERIEANLERTGERINELTERFHVMVDHHETEFKQLLTWQVLMQEKMERWDKNWERSQAEAERERRRLNALSEKTDERIAALVLAIGQMISQAPKEGLP